MRSPPNWEKTDLRMLSGGKLIYICVGLGIIFTSHAAVAYEEEPAAYVSEILPAELLQSLRHRVAEVEVRQGVYHFYLESDYGAYNVATVGLLRERVKEIVILGNAIAQFSTQDDDLSQEIRGQLVIRSDRALDIIKRPVQSAAHLASQVAENLNETLAGPIPDEERDFIYRGGAASDPVSALHKRNVAAQWQLDLYSTNRRVQDFLDAVARARSAGTISAATPALNRQPVKPLKVADNFVEMELAALLKSRNADELRELNNQTLADLNIDADVRDGFLRLPVMSPRHKTRISLYMRSLAGVANLSELPAAAGLGREESDALASEHLAMMLSYYHQSMESLRELMPAQTGINAITTNNTLVHFLVQDLIYWSPVTERKFEALLQQAKTAGANDCLVITSGSITELARTELQNRQFRLLDDYLF